MMPPTTDMQDEEHRRRAEEFFASTPEPEGSIDGILEEARREQYERIMRPGGDA